MNTRTLIIRSMATAVAFIALCVSAQDGSVTGGGTGSANGPINGQGVDGAASGTLDGATRGQAGSTTGRPGTSADLRAPGGNIGEPSDGRIGEPGSAPQSRITRKDPGSDDNRNDAQRRNGKNSKGKRTPRRAGNGLPESSNDLNRPLDSESDSISGSNDRAPRLTPRSGDARDVVPGTDGDP